MSASPPLTREERDLLAVGREGRVELLVEARHRDHRRDLPVQGVEEQELAAALALTKNASELPSGETARSTPPTGPVVSHCATMYS